MFPHTITIVNRHMNKGVVTEYSHEIIGVHYQDKQNVRTGSTEHFTDNNGYVQIPLASAADYVIPDEWNALADKSSKWTLQENDFVEHRNKRTIVSIELIDYGITIPHHFGVELK